MPKISELIPATTLAGTEVLPVVQGGETVKTSVAELSEAAIASDPDIAALADVTLIANSFPARSSAGGVEAKQVTDFALSLLDDANASAARTTLGAQALDATLTALSGQNWASDSLAIGSGADTVAQVSFGANTFPAKSSAGGLVAKPVTDFGLSILDDANAGAVRTTLGGTTVGQGLFTAPNPSAIRWARVNADNSVTFTDAATTRSDIGAQASDATLTALAGQNWAANAIPLGSGADTMSQLALAANTIPGRSSAGNVVAKTVSDTAFTALSQAMYGVYTPTVTNGTNMAANTPREHTWMRVGNTVTVSGFVDADPTAGAATATDFGVSLPVASDFANVWECAGGGFSGEAPYTPAAVFADTTNNRATVVFYANTTAVRTVGYSFTYQVK